MLLPLCVRRAAVCICCGLVLGIPSTVLGRTNYYTANGTEYVVIGSLPGDQVWPNVALNSSGGFVVWQDNATDGSGWGVSAARLDSTLSLTSWKQRVNVQGTNDQENARVAMLKNGGAVFVWQGGKANCQHIYARFLTPTNTFLTTNDLAVSTFTNNSQINPAVTVLNNSNIVVVWASFNQAGSNSMQDVYGQILSPAGQKVGTNFLINQFISYNQRTPAIAALKNGGFVVAWVSEQERSLAPSWGTNSSYVMAGTVLRPSVDIYARLYSSNGVAAGSEFPAATNSDLSANPAVAAAADGSFMLAWNANNLSDPTNSWDICARPFSSAGAGGQTIRVNSRLYGDQYAPRISAIDGDYLIVWTSLGQDGSREGAFGQLVHEDGSLVGGEFRVNTTTISSQMQPVVASDGAGQFLAVWTGYNGGASHFDLYAQRYVNVAAILQPMSAPFVYVPFTLSNGVYQPQLQVSWPVLQGIPVSCYEVYVDGTNSPTATVTNNQWTMTRTVNGLTTNSTHSFQVDYVRTDGCRSPISPATVGTTWLGASFYGIPYEWMAEFFGGYYNNAYHTNFWPLPSSPVASGGPTFHQIFLSGGDPFNSGTWPQMELTQTPQGIFLNWNTQPGLTYQVQVTANLASWSNWGSPRFAAGYSDSINVGSNSAGYYRILLLRQ